MFSEISELETIREQKSRLSARERELTTPVLFRQYMNGSKIS